MKKFIITIILGLLISSSVLARSTGCKEGNCDNGYGDDIIPGGKSLPGGGEAILILNLITPFSSG